MKRLARASFLADVLGVLVVILFASTQFFAIQERRDLRQRRRILDEERVSALVEPQDGAADVRGDPFAVRQWRNAVVAPAGDQRRTADCRQTCAHVVMASRPKLLGFTA